MEEKKMKKIFNCCKNAVKWYLDALAKTSAMCPSCMLPPSGAAYICRINEEIYANKRSKAA